MVVVQVILQSRLVGLLVLEQHFLDPDLLQDGRKLVVVEKVNHGVLQRKERRSVWLCDRDCLNKNALILN